MLAITSALLLSIGQVTTSPGKPDGPAVLQVGIFSYGPDSQPQAVAYTTGLSSESFQYVAGCEIGSGNRPVPDRATDAWRVSGSVERLNEEEAVVRIDWQRVRAGGTAVTAPGGSVQLTLHSGDRVPLDSATPEPSAGCGGRTIGFEARFAQRPGWVRVAGHGPLTESPAVTIMRGAGSGGGAGWGTGSGATTGGSGGGGGSVRQPANANESKEFSADLWLVRTDSRNEKPEFNLQGLILEKVRGTAPFSFSSFTIDTPGGLLTVQISGSVQVTNERGPTELVFTASRNIRSQTSTPNRDATSAVGRSTTRNPMPGPDEVLSFELPAIRTANVTVSDQYSVRLRIR